MKKIICAAIFIAINAIAIPANAYESNEEDTPFNQEEQILIEKTHEEMLSLVKGGASEAEIKEGKFYKELEDLFKSDPKLEELYTENLDVYNEEEVEKQVSNLTNTITVYSNQSDSYNMEDYLIFEDGSSIKITVDDYPVINSNPLEFSAFATHSFGNRVTNRKDTIYHFGWPDGKIQLNTRYNLSRNGIEITGTDHSGTSTIFPSTVVGSTKVEIKNARTNGSIARSLGQYTYTIAGYNGIGLYTIHPTTRTTYTLRSIGSSSVTYDISNIFNKGT